LLRRDLHGLFDGNQLAIEPDSLTVHFAPEAAAWPEYAQLHGRATLAKPQPGFADKAPRSRAFVARWDAFVKEHGVPDRMK
jgi:hypothetical protein